MPRGRRAAWVLAIGAFLDAHPDLAEFVVTLRPLYGGVGLAVAEEDSAVTVLAAWAAALRVDVVDVSLSWDTRTGHCAAHLTVRSALPALPGYGTPDPPVSVQIVTSDEETAAIGLRGLDGVVPLECVLEAIAAPSVLTRSVSVQKGQL